MTKGELFDCFTSPNERDQNGEIANVVDGLFAIARGLHAVANSINRLGNNDAATPMGAVEMLAKEVRDGFESISLAIIRSTDSEGSE